ncbi:MAG: HAD family hydrolase [Acidobacteria bacterium]|nr:HAD family hydrolase [Acidobacteriota bacterium]
MTNELQKAVFLDRDGTLIEEVDFLSRVEDMRLLSSTAAALSRLREAGYELFVVTNQSGIARGFFGESEVDAIHDRLQSELGGLISGFQFCPHMPDAGCRCRKPNVGMIEASLSGETVDTANSWMIGDKLLDIETGFNAGLRTALVRTGYGAKVAAALEREPDLIADDIGMAVDLILGMAPQSGE